MQKANCFDNYLSADELWHHILNEARDVASQEPVLKNYLQKNILQQADLGSAIASIISGKLENNMLPAEKIADTIISTLKENPELTTQQSQDLQAFYHRDCACHFYYQPLCFYKGFHALCSYRVMHHLWNNGQQSLALLLQSRTSGELDVDIHPACTIGSGIMLDHATGIVIGETATIGNNVSIMQSVTLGGTGKESGDRHPKISDGVLVSVGAKILGNILVGEGAKVSAGSVVLKPVLPHTTVAGVPAKEVGKPQVDQPALAMDHKL